MSKLLSKPHLLYNVFQRFNYPRCFLRQFSNFDDFSHNGIDDKKSKLKGKRLPGIGDTKDLWKTISYNYEEELESLVPREIDILIIGGGIIGWSVAYYLKYNCALGVVVVERDPSHTRCASVLGIGAIRQQFSEPENIQMSLYGAEFLRNVREHLSILDLDPPDIQFHPHGFLTLASEKGFTELQKCFELQKQLGSKVELLSKNDIKSIWPWMEVDDIGGGIHGYENEGWFDPWQLLNAFQRKASSLGAQRVIGEVIGFEFDESYSMSRNIVKNPNSKTSIAHPPRLNYALHSESQLNCLLFSSGLCGACFDVRLVNGDIQPIQFAHAVNAAGPWAADISRMLGMGDVGGDGGVIPLPVEPRVQHSFVVSPTRTGSANTMPGIDCPFIVDYKGLNVRRDRLGGDFIVFLDTPPLSKHPQKPPKVDDKMVGESGLSVNFDHFESHIRPQLTKRIPSMGNAKVRSGWASYLDYNYVDQNLIIGFHPVYKNILFTNGSSGHGIEHSMAIGRAIFEMILFAEYKTIDLNNFGMQRFYENLLVFEKEIF